MHDTWKVTTSSGQYYYTAATAAEAIRKHEAVNADDFIQAVAMMTGDSIEIAHVADAIDRLSGGVNDYDATADFAHNLLTDHEEVRAAVRGYIDDTISQPEFDAVVKAAVEFV
jgi:hypothetical protein